ncbi:hypothetical protein GCM10027517_22670 [Phycicoccus ginsengisoli]
MVDDRLLHLVEGRRVDHEPGGASQRQHTLIPPSRADTARTRRASPLVTLVCAQTSVAPRTDLLCAQWDAGV